MLGSVEAKAESQKSGSERSGQGQKGPDRVRTERTGSEESGQGHNKVKWVRTGSEGCLHLSHTCDHDPDILEQIFKTLYT